MNKGSKGEHCKIMRNVDAIKTYHRDPKVVTNIIDLISSAYVRESLLTVNRGKVQKYIGMTIDFSENGKVKFTMHDYIYDMLEELPEDTKTGELSKPAGD